MIDADDHLSGAGPLQSTVVVAPANDDGINEYFNDVVANLAKNSRYTFKSLTPIDRFNIHLFAEERGLFHWDGELLVNYRKVKVLFIMKQIVFIQIWIRRMLEIFWRKILLKLMC